MAAKCGITLNVIRVLESGPSTTLEIAEDLRIDRRKVAARISDLIRLGVVRGARKLRTRTQPATLWELNT